MTNKNDRNLQIKNLLLKKDLFYALNKEWTLLLGNFINRPSTQIIEDCKQELRNGENKNFILRIIEHLSEDIKEALFEEMILIGVSGSQGIFGIVLDILDTMQSKFIKDNLYNVILFNINAFSNEWDIEDNYNQIISILERYELQIEYKHFISNYCLMSSNENIRNIDNEGNVSDVLLKL